VGVARQWCGISGKTENCQAGVYLGYASRKGAALLDRRLYLPKPWFAAERRADWQACRIPEEMPFQTKHELAAQMVEQVRAEPHLHTAWLVCDEWYGDSPLFLDRVAATGLW
jgi:SRSO17 transposase